MTKTDEKVNKAPETNDSKTATKKTSKKGTTSKKKTSSKKQKKMDAKTEAKTKQKITIERQLKYNYPADVLGDKEAMKRWRGQTRTKLRRLSANVTEADSQNAEKKATRELNKFKKEVLADA